MRKCRLLLSIVCLLCLYLSSYAEQMGGVSRTAAIVVDDCGRIVIANRAERTVQIFDEQTKKMIAVVELPALGNGVALSADGTKIYVSTFEDGIGGVHIIDAKSCKIEKSVKAPSGAEFLTIDGGKLYLLARFAGTVEEYDAKDLSHLRSVKVLREPSSMALTDKYIFVSNALPVMASTEDLVTSEVSMIDRATFKIVKNIKLANGSNSLRSMLLTRDRKYITVSHNLGRYTVPTSQLLQGWMNTSAISMIDASTGDFLGSVIVDEPNRGAAGTWGIAQSENGEELIVSHSGTHDVSVIDYRAMIEKLKNYKGGTEQLAYDLRFLYGMRQRVPMVGNGPRLMAAKGDKIYIPTYFSDTLNILNLKDNSIEWIATNPYFRESMANKGEKIFNDATYCYQNWQSCNGCHPGDGRTDGMNWDLMNDGVGNPKNCKSLLFSIQTPPAMITGIRTSAELANRKGFTHIQFYEIPEDDALCVDEYVRTLRPVPSPLLVDGKLSEKAERGKKVYQKLRCDDCHSGPYFTDLKMYRIGDDIEFEKGWDTPTLREVWRTAPYLFDGRAATMEEVYTVHKHGIERKVSQKEIEELVEYVNSL